MGTLLAASPRRERVNGRSAAELPPALGTVRVPGAWVVAIALAAVAAALILYLDRNLTFVGDEWTFVDISLAGASLRTYLEPHNEHWVTLQFGLFQSLIHAVGLRSYLPYLLAMVGFHVATALVLFALLRRRSGDLLALVGAAVLLFFGQGAEDLTWAFQISFLGSVLCGLAALLLLDGGRVSVVRLAATSLLLTAGLMFSGMGLIYLAAAGVLALVDPRRRTLVPALVMPVAAYLAWFALFGRSGMGADRSAASLATLAQLPTYVPYGLGTALASVFGQPSDWAYLALAVVPALFVLRFRQLGEISPLALGAAVGVLFQFLLVGSVRSQFGDWEASSPRYMYVAAPLLLIVAAEAQQRMRGRGAALALAVLGITSVACNIWALVVFAGNRPNVVAIAEAQQRTLYAVREAPDLDNQAVVSSWFPITPERYFSAVDRYGSPIAVTPHEYLATLPAQPVDDGLRAVFASAVRAAPAAGTPTAVCLVPGPSSDGRSLDLAVADGGSLVVQPVQPGTVSVYLWYRGQPPDAPIAEFPADGPLAVRLPDTGGALPRWQVRVVSRGGLRSVCVP